MFRERIAIILTFMLLGIAKVYSQERYTTEICIDFRVNTVYIDSTYMDNAARLDEILQQINELTVVYDAVIRAEDCSVLGIAKLLTHDDNIMSCNLDYCYIARRLEDLFKLGLLTRTKIDRHWIYSPAGAEDGSAEQIA